MRKQDVATHLKDGSGFPIQEKTQRRQIDKSEEEKIKNNNFWMIGQQKWWKDQVLCINAQVSMSNVR